MVYDKKFKTDPKKNFPSVFFLFLFGIILGVVVVQNFLGIKKARVAFSHQLEHLVNLNLIVPEESKKVSLNDNLMTFSGKFRDKESSDSRARFKYLELIDTRNRLQAEQQEIVAFLKELEVNVKDSVLWFFSISGNSIPKSGYVVIDDTYSFPNKYSTIVIKEEPEYQSINLLSMQEKFSSLKKDFTIFSKEGIYFGNDLALLLGKYRSPILGIGAESLKQELKSLAEELEVVLSESTQDQNLSEKASITYAKVLDSLESITKNLQIPVNGIKFSVLRSVRQYTEELKRFSENAKELDQNSVQLEKARQSTSQIVWFFNNKELSSKALEREDPEVFGHWFANAKEEWSNFSYNHSLSFKAPDQPRNLVLEKTFKSEEPAPHYFSYLLTILPIVLIIFLLYFVFIKQMKGVGGTAMSFGKSPARLLQKGQNKITFSDVAGIEEAKEELVEIVDFLKSPAKFTALGGRIPKGVLLIGPPGTGKTLIAKAVAGEADCPFFSIAGSDFVEMFVGVGASRIRDMFEQAKRNSPCIIFIDEIDAVGRHRGAGIGGGHDEREQTLNQLLVEMDGFDTNEGVILMAATNRPDVLDKALLRPGRFDRRVVIGLPDIKGRFEILKVHAKKIKLDPCVDLMAIARSTPGASGADLENLLNEAALLAARQNRSAVTAKEVAEARDKVLYGKERRSLEMDKQEKLTTAYHESGHAVVSLSVDKGDPVDKVTIIPRGLSLGATHFLPEKNRLSYWKKELRDQLAVLMGGRAAEQIFLGDISSGAQQDIVQATRIARSMVCEWGMSENLGTVAYDERTDSADSGYGYHEKNYSDETAKAIDEEVRRILDEAYNYALDIVQKHKDQIELMTKMLIEFETLDAQDVKEIMDNTWDSEKKKARLDKESTLFKKNPDDLPPPPPVDNEAFKDRNGSLGLNMN